jgi:hypothetical protein
MTLQTLIHPLRNLTRFGHQLLSAHAKAGFTFVTRRAIEATKGISRTIHGQRVVAHARKLFRTTILVQAVKIVKRATACTRTSQQSFGVIPRFRSHSLETCANAGLVLIFLRAPERTFSKIGTSASLRSPSIRRQRHAPIRPSRYPRISSSTGICRCASIAGRGIASAIPKAQPILGTGPLSGLTVGASA